VKQFIAYFSVSFTKDMPSFGLLYIILYVGLCLFKTHASRRNICSRKSGYQNSSKVWLSDYTAI